MASVCDRKLFLPLDGDVLDGTSRIASGNDAWAIVPHEPAKSELPWQLTSHVAVAPDVEFLVSRAEESLVRSSFANIMHVLTQTAVMGDQVIAR